MTTKDEELNLIAQWKNGDRGAGNAIINQHEKLVRNIAVEYRRWGVPVDDLVQEGNIGLLRAAKKFEPERGLRLSTYAAYWIRAYMREAVVQTYRIVKLGSSKGERRLLRLLRGSDERDPDVLVAQTGLSRERVLMLLPMLNAHDVSTDAVTLDGDGDTGTTVGDRLPSANESPEAELGTHEEHVAVCAAVREAIATLGPRERQIAEARWLVDEPRTLEELGDAFGVSRERVRQLEERAKTKVRLHLSINAALLAVAPYVERASRHNGAQFLFAWV